MIGSIESDGVGKAIIPRGWSRVTLAEIADYVNGFAFKPSDWKKFGIPIVRIQNLTNEAKPFNFTNRIVDEKYRIDDGDILVSWSATLDVFIWRRGKALLNQHIFKVIPYREIDRRFVFYVLRKSIEDLRKSEHMHGSTMRHVNRGPFLSHSIVLPPRVEQMVIAEKLDELFSHIEKGEDNLKRAAMLVRQYRHSVLKAAVTGELTRDWREKHGGNGETGAELLQSILAVRRTAWEKTELEKMRAKGKLPKNERWKQKYKEPDSPVTTNLPDLPHGWVWATIDAVSSVTGGVTVDAKREVEAGRDVSYLRVANVQRGYLDLEQVKTIHVPEEVVERLALQDGDVLFTEGGDIDKLGRGWVWQGELKECIHQNHVFRARLYNDGLPSKFVSMFGNALGQSYFMGEGKQTTNLASVSLKKLKEFPIPIPPTKEAVQIEVSVDAILSDCEKIEAQIKQAKHYSAALKQTILAAAFSGQLVPQDPKEKPAAVLLDRIAAEGMTKEANKPKRHRVKNTVQQKTQEQSV